MMRSKRLIFSLFLSVFMVIGWNPMASGIPGGFASFRVVSDISAADSAAGLDNIFAHNLTAAISDKLNSCFRAGGIPEDIWVCEGPILSDPKFEGYINLSETSLTAREEHEGEKFQNTITWTAPPSALRNGQEVSLTVSAPKRKGSFLLAYYDIGVNEYVKRGTWTGGETPGASTHPPDQYSDYGPSSKTMSFVLEADSEEFEIGLKAQKWDCPQCRVTWKYRRQKGPSLPVTETKAPGERPPSEVSKEPVATVVAFSEDVRIRFNRREKWQEAKLNQELNEDAELNTGFASSITLRFPDGDTMVISELSTVRVRTLRRVQDRLRVEVLLRLGEIKAQAPPRKRALTSFAVQTPAAATSVRGTIFGVRHDEDTEITTINVEEGEVLVTPANTSLPAFALKAGQTAKLGLNKVDPVAGSGGPQIPDSAHIEFAGVWAGLSSAGGFIETWSLRSTAQGWAADGTYQKDGRALGKWKGEDIRFDNGSMRFRMVLTQPPDPGWSKMNQIEARVEGDRLVFRWSNESGSGQLALSRVLR